MSNKFALSWWVSLFGAGAFVVAGIFFAYSGLGVPNQSNVSGLIGSVELKVRPSALSATSKANVPSSNSKSNPTATITSSVQGSSESPPSIIEVQSSAPVINYAQKSDDLTQVTAADSTVTSTKVAPSDITTLPSGSSSQSPNVRSKDTTSSKAPSTHVGELGGHKKNESMIPRVKTPRSSLDSSITTTTSPTTTTVVKGKGNDGKKSRDD